MNIDARSKILSLKQQSCVSGSQAIIILSIKISKRKSMQRQKGFTLIELLVVIAIIAILAAILFPVFAKVREKARQTTCASNEKQLSLAVLQYVQDYDEKFPACFDQGRTPNINWGQEIYPYVKSLGAFACPSNVIAGAGPTMGYDGG